MLTITRKKPTYDTGIEKNGVSIILPPASKNTFERIAAMGENIGKVPGNQLTVLYQLLTEILNTNTAGIKIENNEVDEIDPITAAAVIREYTDFMRGFRSDPN